MSALAIIPSKNVILEAIIPSKNMILDAIIPWKNVILSINPSVFLDFYLYILPKESKNMLHSFSATGIFQ